MTSEQWALQREAYTIKCSGDMALNFVLFFWIILTKNLIIQAFLRVHQVDKELSIKTEKAEIKKKKAHPTIDFLNKVKGKIMSKKSNWN